MTTSQVVLVTGASEGGLGYALCREFAQRGLHVYAGVRRLDSAQGLEPLGVSLVKLDVTDAESRKNAIDLILSKEGRLDILVNNAGINQLHPVADVQPAELQSMFDTNLFSPIYLSQLVIPYMAQHGSGTIVNISSIGAVVTVPFLGPYNGTKAALTSISNTMRLELQPLGIKVMNVTLGGVQTSIFGKTYSSMDTWPSTSMYASVTSLVTELLQDMMRTGLTPSDTAARAIVSAALQHTPPRNLWTAANSTFAWAASFLPLGLLDTLLKVQFKMASWRLNKPAAVAAEAKAA